MNLTRATAQEIGSVLNRSGVTWSYDDEGDIRIRFRSSQPPGTDAVFYEFDTARGDFSMRGQFLNGRAVPQGNGMTQWEVPLDSGHRPTAIAQKVATLYLMPRPGGLGMQIHAAIAPLAQQRPMHIKVIPGREQVSKIERDFPGFVGTVGDTQFWMAGTASGNNIDESDFSNLVHTASQVGIAMFDGPFTGWLYSTDL